MPLNMTLGSKARISIPFDDGTVMEFEAYITDLSIRQDTISIYDNNGYANHMPGLKSAEGSFVVDGEILITEGENKQQRTITSQEASFMIKEKRMIVF